LVYEVLTIVRITECCCTTQSSCTSSTLPYLIFLVGATTALGSLIRVLLLCCNS